MLTLHTSGMRTLIAGVLLATATVLAHGQTPPAAEQGASAATQLTPLPKGKETDVKFYDAAGKPITGRAAFEKMPQAKLILWLAGNQFFAMDDVVHAFRTDHPATTVGLITLPPGLLLQAIKSGGWAYAGKEYRELPDVYASVSLAHLQQL